MKDSDGCQRLLPRKGGILQVTVHIGSLASSSDESSLFSPIIYVIVDIVMEISAFLTFSVRSKDLEFELHTAHVTVSHFTDLAPI